MKYKTVTVKFLVGGTKKDAEDMISDVVHACPDFSGVVMVIDSSITKPTEEELEALN